MGKIIWTSFRANFWPCTIFSKNISKNITVEEASGRRGAPGGPSWGRPTPGQWLLGPTFSNGSMAIMPDSSSGALAQILLNRGREGVRSSHAHSLHSHSLSHILARISIGFWLKFDCKNSLSLISLLQDLRNNIRVIISFSFH